MRLITSDANSSFRRWLKLATQPRTLRELGRTLTEGTHLAQSVLNAGVRIEALIVRRGARNPEVVTLIDLVEVRSHAPAFELVPALFDRLSPVQTSVGLMLEIAIPLLNERATAIAEDAVYLDGIQDPGNAGALLRVAAAAGVRRVLAAPGTAALWAPRTLRAAQGAHFALTLVESVAAEVAGAALNGSWIAAATHDAPPLWAAVLPAGPVGWVFGSEGQGVSEAMAAQCRQRVRIPLAPGVESLNVAAAAAVCLFERRRRLDLAQ